MRIIKNHKGLLMMALVALAGLFYFCHLYRRDVRSLTDFSVAYEKFDQAASELSIALFATYFESGSTLVDLEHKAEGTLADLKTRGSVRISSLIKNDAELMSTTVEIVELAGKEIDALEKYKRAAAEKDADLDKLAKELGDLTNKRQNAYARFKELAG